MYGRLRSYFLNLNYFHHLEKTAEHSQIFKGFTLLRDVIVHHGKIQQRDAVIDKSTRTEVIVADFLYILNLNPLSVDKGGSEVNQEIEEVEDIGESVNIVICLCKDILIDSYLDRDHET